MKTITSFLATSLLILIVTTPRDTHAAYNPFALSGASLLSMNSAVCRFHNANAFEVEAHLANATDAGILFKTALLQRISGGAQFIASFGMDSALILAGLNFERRARAVESILAPLWVLGIVSSTLSSINLFFLSEDAAKWPETQQAFSTNDKFLFSDVVVLFCLMMGR
jgi:hypothetical protein